MFALPGYLEAAYFEAYKPCRGYGHSGCDDDVSLEQLSTLLDRLNGIIDYYANQCQIHGELAADPSITEGLALRAYHWTHIRDLWYHNYQSAKMLKIKKDTA